MPVTLCLVSPVDPLGSGHLSNDEFDKVMAAKEGVLGYTYADVVIPQPGGELLLKQAPAGVVKSVDDGQKLIDHLTSALPGRAFHLREFHYPEATDVRWRGE